jgi:hypothetical protein
MLPRHAFCRGFLHAASSQISERRSSVNVCAEDMGWLASIVHPASALDIFSRRRPAAEMVAQTAC